jgi:hypothetical protein
MLFNSQLWRTAIEYVGVQDNNITCGHYWSPEATSPPGGDGKERITLKERGGNVVETTGMTRDDIRMLAGGRFYWRSFVRVRARAEFEADRCEPISHEQWEIERAQWEEAGGQGQSPMSPEQRMSYVQARSLDSQHAVAWEGSGLRVQLPDAQPGRQLEAQKMKQKSQPTREPGHQSEARAVSRAREQGRRSEVLAVSRAREPGRQSEAWAVSQARQPDRQSEARAVSQAKAFYGWYVVSWCRRCMNLQKDIAEAKREA